MYLIDLYFEIFCADATRRKIMYLRARLVLFAVALTPCLFCPINQPENGNKPLRCIQDEENRVKKEALETPKMEEFPFLESQETLSPDRLNANPCKNVIKGKSSRDVAFLK